MKKMAAASFSAVISVMMAYSSLTANIKIMNLEIDGTKVHAVEREGKKVNTCVFCHTDAGIKQSKNNYLIDQENYDQLAQMPGCSGSGCHLK